MVYFVYSLLQGCRERNHVVNQWRKYDIRQRHSDLHDVLVAPPGAKLIGLVARSCLSHSGHCRSQRRHVCGSDDWQITADHLVHLSDVTGYLWRHWLVDGHSDCGCQNVVWSVPLYTLLTYLVTIIIIFYYAKRCNLHCKIRLLL